jgi:hypothetical protein
MPRWRICCATSRSLWVTASSSNRRGNLLASGHYRLSSAVAVGTSPARHQGNAGQHGQQAVEAASADGNQMNARGANDSLKMAARQAGILIS